VKAADNRRRLLIALAALASLFLLVVWKIADLQVLNPRHYLAVATSQTLHREVLAADRGAIFDRNHDVLALSVPAKSIFADPKLVTDAHAEAAKLAPLVGLPVNDVIARLTARNRFDYLARKVPLSLANRISGLKLPGIYLLDEPTVVMPDGKVTSALLGAVDIDNNGLSGLESQYDHLLTGKPGELTVAESPQGHTIPVGEHQVVRAVPGSDLVLSVDRSMQYQTEQILSQQVSSARARGGIAIVSDPSTGDILAMVDVTGDPATGQVHPSSNNAALTTVYEPGSVMKIATVAEALGRGVVTPQTKFDVPGSYMVGGTSFSDAEAHGTESMTVSQIVAQSSNIGTIKIAQRLGSQGVYDGIRALGYGQRTALDFPNEAAGVVLPTAQWSGTSIATLPIGQGISATPLQVLEAYNTVANGGRYVSPRLVDATVDPAGHTHTLPTQVGRQAMTAATAHQMNIMLRGVVTGGTGTLAKVDGYTVFGKTGTAREPQPNGGYTDTAGRYHYDATFVGVVPAQKPALSVIVVIDDPSGGNYFGGSIAAPAFSKIASYGLRLFHVPPPSNDVAYGGAPIPGAGQGGVGGQVTLEPDGKVRAVPTGSVTPSAGSGGSRSTGTTSTTAPPTSTDPQAGSRRGTGPRGSSPPTTRKP
jgi:cell division protein FtsI (penicillin-binding protein 3)